MNEIINYVMDTPGSTNPNVLKGLLDKVSGSPGYGYEETRTVIIPEQTVTTAFSEDDPFATAFLALADGISDYHPKEGDTLSITINSETKDVVGVETSTDFFNGILFYFSGSLPDDVPAIAVGITTEAIAGFATVGLPEATYTVKVESVTKSMTVSPEFQEAVHKVIPEPLILTLTPKLYGADYGTVSGATDAEIISAFRSGREVVALIESTPYSIVRLNWNYGRAEAYYIRTSNKGPLLICYYLMLDGRGMYSSTTYTGLVEQ